MHVFLNLVILRMSAISDFVSDTTKILRWLRGELAPPLPSSSSVLGCNLVPSKLSEKGGWRSVLCFLSSSLIPYSSGRRESCSHIHGPCGNGATPPPPALFPSSFHSVLQGLANPLPGHGGEIAGFFFSKPFAGWTSKFQGYSDSRRWEKMRSTTSRRRDSTLFFFFSA